MIKHKFNLVLLLIYSIFFCLNSIYAAVFNLPSHLTNIPIYTSFEANDFITGISSGFYTEEGSAQYEFDLKINYALSNRLLLGANMINSEDIILHVHYQFFSLSESPFKVTGGMTDIPINGNNKLSSFDDYTVSEKNSLSPYISASYFTSIISYHIGYGGSRFRYTNKDKAHLKNTAGLFFGVEIPISSARISIEYDGKDFNLGASLPLTKRTQFYGALTEFFRYENDGSDNVNPQYNNQPLRWFSFGVSHRFNFSKPDSEEPETPQSYLLKDDDVRKIAKELNRNYEKELDQWRQERASYQAEINRLKQAVKEDIRYIDKQDFETKEAFRQQYLSTNQEQSEKVLSYYYESFEYYAQKQYYNAIQSLQKAIALNPYLPQLYIRMGSIYFDLNLSDMARLQWEKALELDPKNSSLQEKVNALKAI